jgi:hypothetical protein
VQNRTSFVGNTSASARAVVVVVVVSGVVGAHSTSSARPSNQDKSSKSPAIARLASSLARSLARERTMRCDRNESNRTRHVAALRMRANPRKDRDEASSTGARTRPSLAVMCAPSERGGDARSGVLSRPLGDAVRILRVLAAIALVVVEPARKQRVRRRRRARARTAHVR